MSLIIGTTPYSQWQQLIPLVELLGGQVEEGELPTNPESGDTYLLLYSRPEQAVTAALAVGQTLSQALNQWQKTAARLLDFHKRNRQQVVMVEVIRAARYPDILIGWFRDNYPELYGGLPQTVGSVASDLNSAMYSDTLMTLIADQLAARDPALKKLVDQLEANSVPLTDDGYAQHKVDVHGLEGIQGEVNDLVLQQLLKAQKELQICFWKNKELTEKLLKSERDAIRLQQKVDNSAFKNKMKEHYPALQVLGRKLRTFVPGFLARTKHIKLVRSSKYFDETWYCEQYPDVARLGVDPVEHYLRHGAMMGLDPSKEFSTRRYLEIYSDVAKSGFNPLVHYLVHGESEGRSPIPNDAMRTDLSKEDQKKISLIRTKLLGLGFTDQPLAELREVAASSPDPSARAMAARELALWHMRAKNPEGWRMALEYVGKAHIDAPNKNFRGRLTLVEMLCHYYLNELDEGCIAYDRASLAGEVSPDLMLARANLQPTPEGRLNWINATLNHRGIPPLALLPDDGQSAYDRLTTAEPLPEVISGPKVTVLVAAYDDAGRLPTALRSLQEQSWKNLEIIVIDDASPDDGATCAVAERFAAEDTRIRLIRMVENGGAYVARNRGLDEATGDYVTLHDADDWSHPLKIETQVRYMEGNPEVMGCTSQQARATEELTFTRLTAHLKLIVSNTSSFLWRRVPVCRDLGYWDTVRFGADSELMNRIEKFYGKAAVTRMTTGPLSFQRHLVDSAVNDPVTAFDGVEFGARKEYSEAQKARHETGDLYYHNDRKGNFPAPALLRPDRPKHDTRRHFDMILASDFRMVGGSTQSNIQELLANKKNSITTAICQMYRYDFSPERWTQKDVRALIDDSSTQVVGYGERCSCDLLVLRYPPVLYHRMRYLPDIDAKRIKVIVNQPPMSDYTPEGVVRYELERCAENIRHYFGQDAEWHPIGPLVRQALYEHHADQLHHINLSDQDWHNIIDIAGWDRGPRKPRPRGKLRIGRHSRDHFVKWPATREDILAAYPPAKDVEVHVLGGAKSPSKLIGSVPKNWVVHPFGSMHPKDFLADIDVWIYFAHPDWVESFGRTIIEAMAVGVPVILPEVYRPLFQDAALYSTPQEAVALARKLLADPDAYDEQVAKAKRYAAEQFSFEMHLKRLQEAGVKGAEGSAA